MRISQGELDRYRAQVASRQDDARAYVLARLRSEARGLTVSEAREASIGIMRDCLSVYGDKAQALSAEMFDEICEAEGIDADPGEMFDDVIDSSKLAGKVHYYAGKLVDGDWDGYAGSNADLAAYYVHRSALENMARNCYKNGVRYARRDGARDVRLLLHAQLARVRLPQRGDRVGGVARALRLHHSSWQEERDED